MVGIGLALLYPAREQSVDPADKKPLADAARDANIRIIKGEERCALRYFV
jgi:hypothetical protein